MDKFLLPVYGLNILRPLPPWLAVRDMRIRRRWARLDVTVYSVNTVVPEPCLIGLVNAKVCPGITENANPIKRLDVDLACNPNFSEPTQLARQMRSSPIRGCKICLISVSAFPRAEFTVKRAGLFTSMTRTGRVWNSTRTTLSS